MKAAEVITKVFRQFEADVKAEWAPRRMYVDEPQTEPSADRYAVVSIPGALAGTNATPISDFYDFEMVAAGVFPIPPDTNSTLARLELASGLRDRIYRSEQLARDAGEGYGEHGFLVLVREMLSDDNPIDAGKMRVSLSMTVRVEVRR